MKIGIGIGMAYPCGQPSEPAAPAEEDLDLYPVLEGDTIPVSDRWDDDPIPPGLTLKLVDESTTPATVVASGITHPYLTSYPATTPGTRLFRLVNESDATDKSPRVSVVVEPQVPVLDLPVTGFATQGDTVTFTASGGIAEAVNFDDNTDHVDFLIGGSVVATANAAPWTVDWVTDEDDDPFSDQAVIARRYYTGLAGETGYEDSEEVVTFTLIEAGGDAVDDLTNAIFYVQFDEAADLTIVSGTPDRLGAVVDRISGSTVTQAATRPEYQATGYNGHGCIVFAGAERLDIALAAVVAAGVDQTHVTIYAAVEYSTVDAIGTVFSWGAPQSPNPRRTKHFGQNTTGSGSHRFQGQNDAGTTLTPIDTSSSISAARHIIKWKYDGTTLYRQQDGGTEASAAYAPGTLTPTRAAIGYRCGLTGDLFLTGKVAAVFIASPELSSVDEAILLAAWQARYA